MNSRYWAYSLVADTHKNGILFLISLWSRNGIRVHIPIAFKPVGESKNADTMLIMLENVKR